MLKDLPRACEGETDAFQAPHKSKNVHIKDLFTCEGIWCIINLNNCMLWGYMLVKMNSRGIRKGFLNGKDFSWWN